MSPGRASSPAPVFLLTQVGPCGFAGRGLMDIWLQFGAFGQQISKALGSVLSGAIVHDE